MAALHAELPAAVRLLQDQNISPVDMAQSVIGPGMRVFSRYRRVVEASGDMMTVRTALALINQTLEEILTREEGELDDESRFALTWFRQFGHGTGPFGDAEVLFKAMVTTESQVVAAGITESRLGRVRLLERDELSEDWSPADDPHRSDWRAVQQLIRRLDQGEKPAAQLLRQLGGQADRARRLAYLLYQVCDEKGWTKLAVDYNMLVSAWPELTRLAASADVRQESML